MATEFNDEQHFGLFFEGGTLSSSTSYKVRQSELTLAAMRAAGVLDIMVDGTVPPTTDKLWLDKNSDPAILKIWDSTGLAWVVATFDRLFNRAILTLAITALNRVSSSANSITVTNPADFRDGLLYSVVPTANNTGNAFITVQGVGTYPVMYLDDIYAAPNELTANTVKVLFYKDSKFYVLFPTAEAFNAMAAAEAAQESAEAAQEAAEAARDIAAGYVSDAVSQGNVPIYATVAGMSSINVPVGINAIRVNGQATAGDSLGGLFIDTDTGSDDTFLSGDGRTWYRSYDVGAERIDPEMRAQFRNSGWPQVPFASSTPDDAEYSHFPVLAAGNTLLGVLYKHGPQHDSSDHTAVCQSQKPAAVGAQNLVINGTLASGGVVTAPAATKVEILSDANDSARTFTVFGLVNGVPDSEAIAGPTANYTTTSAVATKDFSTVTQMQVDGATAGNIRVGLLMVPQNLSFRYSRDGGRSWSSRVNVFDGVADVKNYYWGALGTLKDMSFIALCTEIDITSGARRAIYKKSLDGIKWDSTPTQIAITGDVPTTCCFFGKVQRTPSGRLVVGVYDGSKSYVMWSDDDGNNWVSKTLITDGATQYSEITIGIIDELNWVAMIRIDNVVGSMLQMKTTDGGLTWTDQGGTNLPTSGGYKSHDLATVYVDGVSYLVLTYMARQTTSGPAPNINSMCMRWVPSEKALAAATSWSAEYVVVDSATILSGYTAPGTERSLAGYPSLWVNPESGLGLLAYGRETAYYHAARVETKKLDIVRLIKSGEWTPVLTCATPGNLDVTYTTQRGTISRNGRLVTVTFEVVTSSFTHTTASGALRITGLTDTSNSGGQVISGALEWSGIKKADYTQVSCRVGPSARQINFRACGLWKAPDDPVPAVDVAITDLPTGGSVRLIGTVTYVV